MNSTMRNDVATESTELATGEPPIRSRVAPDINPMGGGIVDDSQAAGTSPGDGTTHTKQLSGEEIAQARAYAAQNRKHSSSEPKHPSIMDKVSGFGNVVAGKMFDNPGKVAYGKAKAQGEV